MPTTAEAVGRTVFDGAGGILGRLTALYIDAETDQISFGAVALTHRGRRHTVFVPLDAATLAGDSIMLRCGGQLVRQSPGVRRHRGLPAEVEEKLYAHYDMPYVAPVDGSRRLLPAP